MTILRIRLTPACLVALLVVSLVSFVAPPSAGSENDAGESAKEPDAESPDPRGTLWELHPVTSITVLNP